MLSQKMAMMNIFVVCILFLIGPAYANDSFIRMQLVDMTHGFDNDTLHDPSMKKFTINVIQNGTFQEKFWLQLENYESGIHTGTHMDAPCHFSKGKWTLDDIPVERFFLTAAVIDVEKKSQDNPDYQATIQDLQTWEKKHQRRINGNMILLLKTGWSKRWGDIKSFIGTLTDDRSQYHYPGLHPVAANWLADNRDFVAAGTETLSLDYGQSRESLVHDTLLRKNIYFLENVANIHLLPECCAEMFVMPMKISRGGGAPVRIFARFPSF